MVKYLTSQSCHEALNGTAHWPKDEIAVDGSVEGNCKSKADHDHTSHSQVDKDEVERLPELLVLSSYHQCQAIDGEAKADEEEHVDRQQLELPWVS